MVSPRLVTKIEAEEPTLRLAVLIDADNAQAAVIEGLLAEIARFGEATVKRIYGDFTAPASASWKKVLQKYAIKPVQQFAYTTGKNATDSTLIIDAMDLLYTRKFDGFCLITSDSDFTGLAMRLREEGLTVLGFGEKKTPEAFRNACHKFVFTEVLRPDTATESAAQRTKKTENDQKSSSPQPAAQAPETKQAYFRCVVIYPFGDEWLETAAPPKRCAVGSMVPVRFLPEDPGTALVGRLPDLLFGPIFMSLWGVALIAGAVFFHGNP